MKQKQESARDWIEDSERQKNIEPILQEAKGRGRREIALKETDHNVPSMMADINISILQRSTEQDGEEDGRGDNKAHVAMWALLSEYSESLRRQNALFAPDYQPITWQRLCNLACRRGEDDLQKFKLNIGIGKEKGFYWLFNVVGACRVSLTISQTAHQLGFSLTTISSEKGNSTLNNHRY